MKRISLAIALITLPTASFALDMKAAEASVDTDMKIKLTPAIITAIKAQNAAHAGLDTATIKKLDDQWKAEVSAANKPLINKVLNNETSAALKKIQQASSGKYIEIFVVDNKGLNVGQTGLTSDYWQGDEAKFTKVFPTISTHSETPEFDESAQAFVGEVDGTIVDAGVAIGTYTVKINAD